MRYEIYFTRAESPGFNLRIGRTRDIFEAYRWIGECRDADHVAHHADFIWLVDTNKLQFMYFKWRGEFRTYKVWENLPG